MKCQLCHDEIPYPIPGQKFCSDSHQRLWDKFGSAADLVIEALIDHPDGLTREELFEVIGTWPSFAIATARLKHNDLMIVCDRKQVPPVYSIPTNLDDAWHWLVSLGVRRTKEMQNLMRYCNVCANLYAATPAGYEWQDIRALLGMVQRRFAIARLEIDGNHP